MRLATSLIQILGALFMVVASAICTAEAQSRPNILIILTDDMGYGDPSSYNPNSQVTTTNIDNLAANGIRFTNAHSPSSVCTPTRYGLLTGQSAYRIGENNVVFDLNENRIAAGRGTMAEMLQQEGYQTGMIGKWHLGFNVPNDDPLLTSGSSGDTIISPNPTFTGGPIDHGFDYAFGRYASANQPPHKEFENDHWVNATSVWTTRNMLDLPREGGGGITAGWGDPGYDADQITRQYRDKAVDYIDTHANQADPFFLYLALPSPHWPVAPHDDFINETPHNYTDFILEVDDTVGKVVEALGDNGILEDTLIVFISDNGAQEGFANQGSGSTLHQATGVIDGTNLRGAKFESYEGGHRVPFIAQWGNASTDAGSTIQRGVSSDELISHLDLFATLAVLVGGVVGVNDAEDSWNMLPALLGDGTDLRIREALFNVGNREGGITIAQKDDEGNEWKLIFGSTGTDAVDPLDILDFNQIQLFNLSNDIGEQTNLLDGGGTAEMQAKALELQSIMQGYLTSGRSAPVQAPEPGAGCSLLLGGALMLVRQNPRRRCQDCSQGRLGYVFFE